LSIIDIAVDTYFQSPDDLFDWIPARPNSKNWLVMAQIDKEFRGLIIDMARAN
jgi:hypothetical protein